MPEDWQPDREDFEFAASLERPLTANEVRSGADEFKDYWRGPPGARGQKLDWRATFRNRLRELSGRKAKGNPARAGPFNGTPPKRNTAFAVYERLSLEDEPTSENPTPARSAVR